MSATSSRKLLWLGAVALVIVIVAAFLFKKNSDAKLYSANTLKNERGLLVKQDMTFTARGRNFAHYAVTAISDKGDTVVAQYRVPANSRKLRALLWVYDSASDLNFSALLDQDTRAQHAAVLGYNVHENFERENDGSIANSRVSHWKGLARTRREVDILLQLFGKHQVLDSTEIYVGGEGLAAVALLAATAGLPHRLAGASFVNLEDGLENSKNWDQSQVEALGTWSADLRAKRISLISQQRDSRSVLETAQFKSPVDKITANGTNIESVLSWVVGADTVVTPAKPDTTFTKVVKVRS